jgi:hypothetical protein
MDSDADSWSVLGSETDDEDSAWSVIGSEDGDTSCDDCGVPISVWEAGDFPPLARAFGRTARAAAHSAHFAHFASQLWCTRRAPRAIARRHCSPPRADALDALSPIDGADDDDDDELEGGMTEDESEAAVAMGSAPLQLANEDLLGLPCRRTGHTLRARCHCRSCRAGALDAKLCATAPPVQGALSLVDEAYAAVGCHSAAAALRWLREHHGVEPMAADGKRRRARSRGCGSSHASLVQTLAVPAAAPDAAACARHDTAVRECDSRAAGSESNVFFTCCAPAAPQAPNFNGEEHASAAATAVEAAASVLRLDRPTAPSSTSRRGGGAAAIAWWHARHAGAWGACATSRQRAAPQFKFRSLCFSGAHHSLPGTLYRMGDGKAPRLLHWAGAQLGDVVATAAAIARASARRAARGAAGFRTASSALPRLALLPGTLHSVAKTRSLSRASSASHYRHATLLSGGDQHYWAPDARDRKSDCLDLDLGRDCLVTHVATKGRAPAASIFPSAGDLQRWGYRRPPVGGRPYYAGSIAFWGGAYDTSVGYDGPVFHCVAPGAGESDYVARFELLTRADGGGQWLSHGVFSGNRNGYEMATNRLDGGGGGGAAAGAFGVDGVSCRYLRFRPLSEVEGGFKGNKCLRVGAFGVPLGVAVGGGGAAATSPSSSPVGAAVVQYTLESTADVTGKVRSSNRLGPTSSSSNQRGHRFRWQRERRNLRAHIREELTGKRQRHFNPDKRRGWC